MVLYKIVLGKESLIRKICIEEKDMDRYEKPKALIEFCMMKNK